MPATAAGFWGCHRARLPGSWFRECRHPISTDQAVTPDIGTNKFGCGFTTCSPCFSIRQSISSLSSMPVLVTLLKISPSTTSRPRRSWAAGGFFSPMSRSAFVLRGDRGSSSLWRSFLVQRYLSNTHFLRRVFQFPHPAWRAWRRQGRSWPRLVIPSLLCDALLDFGLMVLVHMYFSH